MILNLYWSLWKEAVPICPNFTITLLFFLRIVCMIGLIIGKLTSYDPGPGSSIYYFLVLDFLALRETEPKGA